MGKLKSYNNTKGVHQRKNGKFEAYVVVKHASGKSKTSFKAHIGTYKTETEAKSARINFINSLA